MGILVHLVQGALSEEGRGQVHDQRARLLQPCAGEQRGRRRRRARRVDQGIEDWVAGNVSQLGPELAEQLVPHRPVPLLPGDHQRRPHHHQLQRRPCWLAVRPDVRGGPVLARKKESSEEVLAG